jgi:hypothetical protein
LDDLIGLLIQIIVAILVIAPVLWLVGRAIAGKQNAKFTDAIWIVVLGIIIGSIVNFLVGSLLGGIVSSIIMLFVWLALIKHFFDCGWIKAFAIALVAVIAFVVIAFILALIGIGIGIGLGTLGF